MTEKGCGDNGRNINIYVGFLAELSDSYISSPGNVCDRDRVRWRCY